MHSTPILLPGAYASTIAISEQATFGTLDLALSIQETKGQLARTVEMITPL
jgi:hypothetical protein